jgi:hypothetical protein
MTEPTASTAVTKKKRSLILPIGAAIVAIAVAGFVASRAGLDKALVKQQVDDFIVRMHEQGKAQGRDLNLTYADIEVSGGFTNKHVVMKELVLTVRPLERASQTEADRKTVDSLRITTPAVQLYPGVSSLTIKAVEPIDFAGEDEPNKSLLKVTSATPLEVTVSSDTQGEIKYSNVDFISPEKMEFVYLRETQAEGKEEETPQLVAVYETLTMTASAGSGFKSSVAGDGSGLGKASISYRDLVIVPQKTPEANIKLAEIAGDWSNVLNEKKLNVVHGALKMGPITSDAPDMPYQPVMLEFDGSFEGAMPKSPEAVAGIQSPESVMTLKTLSLSTKDATLKATANFTANASDMLPVGAANIALTNAPYVMAELRKYHLLNENSEGMVLAMLERITGTPSTQMTDIVIPIERTRGGAFKIGSATFEELFALMLKQAMDKQPAEGVSPDAPDEESPQGVLEAPLVPQLPPSDKPKATPIEVPDPSVRG